MRAVVAGKGRLAVPIRPQLGVTALRPAGRWATTNVWPPRDPPVQAGQTGAAPVIPSMSTAAGTTPPPPPRGGRSVRRFLGTTVFLVGSFAVLAYYQDSRSAIHEHVIMPVVRRALDAEESHRAAVRFLAMKGWPASWLRPSDKGIDGPELGVKLWDLELSNPVGLAAGFDKDAEAIDGLFDLGFGYVEVGSITPEPQPGNPKPRFFRLEEDDACINRYGFNSLGHRQALHQLQARIRSFAFDHPSLFPSPLPYNPLPPTQLPRSLRPGKLLAVNLGKNKTSAADSNEDYIAGVRMLGPYADVLVVNVSSPNTPGLRGLQGKDFLGRLLSEVVKERNNLPKDLQPKVVVKVAPDLNEHELEDIASAIRQSAVDGVIVSNTTIKRDGLGLRSAAAGETGGLSGRPVKPLSILALSTLRSLLPPSTPIIGCGGISNGQDAIDFAKAGATFVQAYTGFGYAGVGFPRKIKDEIAEQLRQQDASWTDLVEQTSGRWQAGLDKVKEELETEAGKLREVMQSPAFVPIEDKAAEKGIDSEAPNSAPKMVEPSAQPAPVEQAPRLLTADEMSRLLNDSLSAPSDEAIQAAPQAIPDSAHGERPSMAPATETVVKTAGLIAIAAIGRRSIRSHMLRPTARAARSPAVNSILRGRKYATTPPTPSPQPDPTTTSGKIKLLFQRYGRHAVAVYLVLSAVDLSLTFAVVHLAGADQIEKGQHWVMEKWKQIRHGDNEQTVAEHAQQILEEGIDHTKGAAQKIVENVTSSGSDRPKSKSGQTLFWTEFALAYGIHKTLLLPVRAGLTAAWTPKIVNWLTRRGWIGKGGATRAAAHAQTKMKAASEKVREMAKRN